MDGVRACWYGDRLISRQGNIISCPEWFTSTLPTAAILDGELWMGQGTSHENIMEVLLSTNGDWGQMKYYVFDIPSYPGTYEERMTEMEGIKSRLPPHVVVVDNVKCTGTDHLYNYSNSILACKGEGIMLREPQSLYIQEVTTSLLKVKV